MDPRLRADPAEQPAFMVRSPVSGEMIEVVDRRTYERVTSLFADRLREAVVAALEAVERK